MMHVGPCVCTNTMCIYTQIHTNMYAHMHMPTYISMLCDIIRNTVLPACVASRCAVQHLLPSSHTAIPAKTTQKCVATRSAEQYFCKWSAGQNDMYFSIILYVSKNNRHYRFTDTTLTINFGFWRQACFCLISHCKSFAIPICFLKT